MLASIPDFLRQLLLTLPGLLGRLALAWVISFCILLYGFQTAKKHLRPQLLRIDDGVRAWAEGLRYQTANQSGERVWLTWFFRLWTNLASAPSLCFWSLAVPWWMYQSSAGNHFQQVRIWLLPGLCFALSMLLSYLLKRIFKRLRPPRIKGAFGHRMKDHSFPSGHSLTAFCFWSMLLVAAMDYGASLPVVLACGLIAATIVCPTGLSRVYLGVHFPSDILGGYVIGLIWSVACYLALRPALL